jgi:hypothetical protein
VISQACKQIAAAMLVRGWVEELLRLPLSNGTAQKRILEVSADIKNTISKSCKQIENFISNAMKARICVGKLNLFSEVR